VSHFKNKTKESKGYTNQIKTLIKSKDTEGEERERKIEL
jgi:hypothetical protein